MRTLFVRALVCLVFAIPVLADSTPFNLAGGNLTQDWTNIGLITANDDWAGVPSITGFRGDGLTGATGTDPQTLLAANDPGVLDVNANQTNPDTFGTGGVTEFHITNPVVALTGSGTADAPYLQIYLNTTGRTNVNLAFNARDIDGSTDNTNQQIAVHYRVGSTGAWTNLPDGYIADASTGPSLATLVTAVSVDLPPAANNQAEVQIRIMSTNAASTDEWIGIDDIVVSSQSALPTLSINDVSQAETNAGTTTFTFTVSLTAPAGAGGVTFDIATADGTAEDGNPLGEDDDYIPTTTPGGIVPGDLSTTVNISVFGDTDIEPNETFFVNITNIVGATAGDTQGLGTIENDDSPTLNIDDVSLVEGPSGTTTFTFTVSLTQPAGVGGVTFDIATADDTATVADNDYVTNSLTGQTISAGNSTYTFDVTVNGDNNVESTETFFVNVANIAGASAGDTQGLGTIVTDEPQLSINNVTQAETNAGTTTFAFTVSLDIPAPAGGVTFDIATAPGTATAGTDYVHQALTGQTITAGNTTYTFNVTVNGDGIFETSETFFVDVTNVSAGVGVADGQGLGTITNDDPVPAFTIADVAMAEGDAGTQTMTFTVALSGTREVAIDVDVATADSSATVADSDYVSNSTTLTFGPGDATQTFDVTINGDTSPEGNEQFFVNLSNATGGATISDAQALGIIRLDDPFSIAAVDTQYLETFDVLAQTGTAATTPVGWTQSESGGNADFVYAAGTGSSNGGNTYSFGVAATNPVTDRAFGGLQSGSLVPTIGAFYRNETTETITTLSIEYTGEQWRLGSASRADRLDFQYSLDATSLSSGIWLDANALDFTTPNQAGTGAKDGNAPANRTTLVYTISGLSLAPGSTFWIRFNDFGASGADDGLAVDDFSIIANFGGAFITIDDVQAFEGNAGTTTYSFTVALTQPAPPGGVTFDITTIDGSATVANSDYIANTLLAQTIAAGNTTYTFDVTVNGDTAVEPSEQFFVEITNITNALPADTQGVGTIIDDDATITFIHDIQGPGASSPIVGSSITLRGIVTGVKTNGFFVQEEEADYDADPATSEGVFVFTSSSPPAGAVMGAEVMVSGTVAEFVPSGDPQQPPFTEITFPTTVQISTGNTLPAPVVLTTTFPDPAGPFDQLERVEAMRVQVNSLTVVAPTDGSFNEITGFTSSNGRFYGVVTGTPRPFREAGVRAPDTVPTGSIPPIPRWDYNPERLKVESNALGAGVLVVKTHDVVAPLAGPLDYGFRAYAILPDGTVPSIITPGTVNTTTTAPLATEVTVASFNLYRLFNDVAEGSGPTVQTSVYQNRLGKASLAIRENLNTPDIVGVQEVENLGTLQDLAARINADAVTAAQPDPLYVAYLVEGNDIGGIDVGFLVKTGEVSPGLARVVVNSVTQELDGSMWIDPDDGNPATLHDRPPLVLDATVNRQAGVSFDLTVINNHLRSLIGIDSEDPDGLTTEGDRVRQKRLAQAEDLANLIQSYQTGDPLRNIIVIGDFNAFEVNDGYTDVMNVLAGTPPPDNETVVPGDGVDLVNPDLDNLVDTPPAAERYSYLFEGNAQNIDHALVNQALINATGARRIEHPRIDADHPDTDRNNPATAIGISDHDPLVAYLNVMALAVSDFGVTLTHPTGYATAGANTSYTINVANNGPDAGDASMTIALPAGTTFQSLSAPAGWSCTTPSVGGNGTVTCDVTAMAASTNVNFTLTAGIDAATPANTVVSRTAMIDGANVDPVAANDSESEDVVVLRPSQYRATKTVSTTGVTGTAVTYTITIFNDKPFAQGDNAGDELVDVLPSGVTLVSASASGGTAVATVGTNTVTWNGSIASGGSVTITINATVDGDATGTQSNQATLADDFDADGVNERASVSDDPSTAPANDPTSFTVVATNSFVATKSVEGGSFIPGGSVIYEIVLTNGFGHTLDDNPGDEFLDVLPPQLQLVSATATSGTAVATTGTNTVTWNGSLASGASVTITIEAVIPANATSGTVLNQGQANVDLDDNGTNETAVPTDDPDTGGAQATGFVIVTPDQVTATKSVVTSGVGGDVVTYTIVVTNNTGNTLPDNATDELVDVLPAQVQIENATATTGTVTFDAGTNTVRWNGSLADGASVTITIAARLSATATGSVSNQATFYADLDNSGDNESAIPTNSAAFTAAAVAAIPALSPLMMLLLAAMLGLAAMLKMMRS